MQDTSKAASTPCGMSPSHWLKGRWQTSQTSPLLCQMQYTGCGTGPSSPPLASPSPPQTGSLYDSAHCKTAQQLPFIKTPSNHAPPARLVHPPWPHLCCHPPARLRHHLAASSHHSFMQCAATKAVASLGCPALLLLLLTSTCAACSQPAVCRAPSTSPCCKPPTSAPPCNKISTSTSPCCKTPVSAPPQQQDLHVNVSVTQVPHVNVHMLQDHHVTAPPCYRPPCQRVPLLHHLQSSVLLLQDLVASMSPCCKVIYPHPPPWGIPLHHPPKVSASYHSLHSCKTVHFRRSQLWSCFLDTRSSVGIIFQLVGAPCSTLREH
jgi:hypothetical protein